MYNRRSIRLKGYDYSQPGEYFVTICTEQKQSIFGKIINGKIQLNEWGILAEKFISITENHFQRIKFDTYIIMPNHIHIIIIIENPAAAGARSPRPQKNELTNGNGLCNNNDSCNGGGYFMDGRGNPAPTLGQIVGFYKYGVTKRINWVRGKTGVKLWQRNYYEHIIRDSSDFYRIRQYIKNNPLKWGADYLTGNNGNK